METNPSVNTDHVFSVGSKMWKSSDGETYMMAHDIIKPTIDLIPLNTYCCFIDFRKTNTKNQSLLQRN